MAFVPVTINAGWIHRWRLEWGLTKRAVTVTYSVSWKDVVVRVGIGLRNNIRVRQFWKRMFPGVPFRVITFDQKPMWYNANGCSDIRWRAKGLGVGVGGMESDASGYVPCHEKFQSINRMNERMNE